MRRNKQVCPAMSRFRKCFAMFRYALSLSPSQMLVDVAYKAFSGELPLSFSVACRGLPLWFMIPMM